MATRGRFSQQTGGSNLSSLIYDIMRQQYSRTVSSLISSYNNQVDYRGGGVPTAEDVISYLQNYSGNNWVSQADRDEISLDIANVQRTERSRRETVMINAINENPGDSNAIQTYIDFLQESISGAQTAAIAAESRDKLFSASKDLLGALGTSLGTNAISVQEYDSRAAQIVNSYAADTSNRREIMSVAADKKFQAQYNVQNTLLATAAGQGAGQYYRQLQQFKKFLVGARRAVVSAGLGETNADGNIIAGSSVALNIQKAIGDVNGKMDSAGKTAQLQNAVDRINRVNNNSSGFLSLVNGTLGSNYGTLEDFAKNQIDVQRFYAVAPSAAMGSKDYIDQNSFLHVMFNGNNSILAARKALSSTSDSAMASYSSIVDISKKYGRNTLVDDTAILFADWFKTTGDSRGDTTLNTQKAQQIFDKYQALVDQQGANITPEELAVHEYTLSIMQSALNGDVTTIDRPTAWDLANPDASQYDTGTSKYASQFSGVVQLIANDAVDARDIASGNIPVANIAPDGKWEFKGSVRADDPNSNVLPIIDTSSGRARLVAVAATDIVVPNSVDPNQITRQGKIYNLGNGNFIIQAESGGYYEKNFDPFSGKTMTYGDFRNKYTQRVASGISTGDTTITQTPQFVATDSGVTATSGRPEPTSDLIKSMTAGIDARIESVRLNTNITPDSVDRIVGSTVWSAMQATKGTNYESDIAQRYSNIQLPGINPGSSTVGAVASPKDVQTSYNDFRAGERADRLTAVAFRNAPAIANVFTPNGSVRKV